MKRTNIVLDEELHDSAKRLTGLQTTRGLVDHALRELVRRKNQRRILKLRGVVEWEGNLAEMRVSTRKANCSKEVQNAPMICERTSL